MTTPATYTLIQRDAYGDAVNTITGLAESYANQLADVLETGDAYQGEQPWTCEVVAELSPAEQTAAIVDKWLADGESLTRADHLVACLRRVAETLESLGDKEIPRVGLKVELHLYSHGGTDEERMTALDELAAVFGRKGEMSEGLHYHTGHIYGAGLRMVTIPEPPAAPPKLLVISDETIAEAEQIGRMVPAADLHLPQAECGCPIKQDSYGTRFVDHCAACEESR